MSQTHPNTMHGGQILANALVRQGVELAFGVGKTDVDVFDVFVLDQFQSFLDCAHHAAFRVEVKTMGRDLMDPVV